MPLSVCVFPEIVDSETPRLMLDISVNRDSIRVFCCDSCDTNNGIESSSRHLPHNVLELDFRELDIGRDVSVTQIVGSAQRHAAS